jgi:ketosteroid isomerase-like protein
MPLINDNGIDREMTADEVIALDKMQKDILANDAIKKAAEDAKEAAKSKLEALGLTIDDLKALGL